MKRPLCTCTICRLHRFGSPELAEIDAEIEVAMAVAECETLAVEGLVESEQAQHGVRGSR